MGYNSFVDNSGLSSFV